MDNRTKESKFAMNALIKSRNWVQKLLGIRMNIFIQSVLKFPTSSVPCDFFEK